MTISYPLTLPGSGYDIAAVTFTQRNQQAKSESPYTFGVQVYDLAQRWEVEVELNLLTRAEAEPWLSVLGALRGQYGTFLMGDPAGSAPRGSAGGSPKVRTNSQVGFSLTAYGFTSSATNILRAGDYIQLGTGGSSRLHKVLQDVNTTSGGVCTMDIWPSLRSIPSSGSTIVVNSAQGLFRLASNGMPWRARSPNLYEIQFTAVEAL